MKKRGSKKQNSQSAETQSRCIWMTAGVISFKLCPFNYDCEHCDLDKAMRSQVKSRRISSKVKKYRPQALVSPEKLPLSNSDLKKTSLFFTFSAGEVEEGLYLHPAHLWIRQIESKKWKMGIDKLLAYVLPPPVKIKLCGPNKKVIRNQVFGKIHTEVGVISLTLPLTGHLVQTNSKLTQHPELVQQDPYGEGWLGMMEWPQSPSELEGFYAGLTGKKFLEEEVQHLKFLLKHRGVEVNHLGATLPDGGIDIKYLHQVLSKEVCLKLAGELMITGQQAW